jgi:metallophosphoesterase (TIGR00282 family)
MSLKVICLGDVVGRSGRDAVRSVVPELRKEYAADMVVLNGENAAGGIGLDSERARELILAGANVITLGDHTWSKRDLHDYLEKHRDLCIRPANYPSGAPGRGWTIWTRSDGFRVGVMNLIGRVFMNFPLDCPFRKADEILDGPLKDCDAVICDMHAEATSEKVALGRYVDGRASLVFGTHTHVQTADERILSDGCAYITDLGMCGGLESVIGMDPDVAIDRFLSGMPHAYQVANGDVIVSGVFCEIDTDGNALAIERIRRRVEVPRSRER